MAMLVLPDVFLRTWGIRCQPFWPRVARQVREVNPEFCFMAEVYWDLEWTMLQQGFEYAYDKRLYDRLKEGHARPVREHFFAGLDYQSRMARFLENHDEPRVAADFAAGIHKRQPSSLFCHRASVSFTRVSWRGGRSAFHLIWSEVRKSLSIKVLWSFMINCLVS